MPTLGCWAPLRHYKSSVSVVLAHRDTTVTPAAAFHTHTPRPPTPATAGKPQRFGEGEKQVTPPDSLLRHHWAPTDAGAGSDGSAPRNDARG